MSRLQRLRSFNFKNSKHLLRASTESNLRAGRIPKTALVDFPRGKPTIADWATTMVSHYAAHDDADPNVRHRRLSSLTVKELLWYQGTDDMEHEYVVAIIADPQYVCERFIRLDRVRDDPGVESVKPFAARYNRFARSSASMSSQSSLSLYDEPVNAKIGCLDAIWVLSELPRLDRVVEHTVFRNSHDAYWAPTLLDLALVARAVHEKNTYHIWPRQCAWFSAMIVRVMQSEFHHQITHRDLALLSQSQIIGLFGDSTGNQKAQECLEQDQDQVIFDIVLAYRAVRDDVTTQIEEAIYQAKGHNERHVIIEKPAVQPKKADTLVTTATALAIEATMRAAEADARAEKEARLREEAEERAHDEARRHAASKRELRDLRCRLEELEASFRTRGLGARLNSKIQRLTTTRTLVQ